MAVTEKVVITPDSSFYPEGTVLSITMSCATPGVTIYYTLDQSNPDPASATSYLYTGPFNVTVSANVFIYVTAKSFRAEYTSNMWTINVFGSGIPVQPIISNGLAGWYDSQQTGSYSGVGSTWYDVDGSPDNITLYNSPTWTAAINSDPSYFTFSSPMYGSVPLAIGSWSVGTISAWVSFGGTGAYSRWMCCLTKNSAPSSYWSHQLGINSNYLPSAYLWDGSQRNIAGTTPVNLNQWYHLCYRWIAGQNHSIFLNGNKENTLTIGTPQTSDLNQFWFGKPSQYFGNINFDGKIGELVFYNRALSDSEITQNFNNTVSYYNGHNLPTISYPPNGDLGSSFTAGTVTIDERPSVEIINYKAPVVIGAGRQGVFSKLNPGTN